MIYEDSIFALLGVDVSVLDVSQSEADNEIYREFIEIIGSDIDDAIIPINENLIDTLLVPDSMDADYFPYLEQLLGVAFYTGSDTALRRMVIKNVLRLYPYKGTTTVFDVLFSWLGLSYTMTIYDKNKGFDHADETFDSILRIFDSAALDCTSISLAITGAGALDDDLTRAINSVLEFNIPIIVNVIEVTYNAAIVPLAVGVAPTITSFALDGGATTTVDPIVSLDLVYTGTATYFMVSESSSFVAAVWQPISLLGQFLLSAGNGARVVYIKIKNGYGVSADANDGIVMVIPVPTVTADDFVLDSGAFLYSTITGAVSMKIIETATGVAPTPTQWTNAPSLSVNVKYPVTVDTYGVVRRLSIRVYAYSTDYDTDYLEFEVDELDQTVVVSNYSGFGVSGFGLANGTMEIIPSDGIPPYTHLWSVISGGGTVIPTAQAQTGMPAGAYQCIVTDYNGHGGAQFITLTQPDLLEMSAIVTHVTTPGGSDGAIDLTVTGGVPPPTFIWSTSDGSGLVQGQEDQTGLTAGTYRVIVIDQNSISIFGGIEITEP